MCVDDDGVGDDNSLSVDEEDGSSLALTTETSALLSRFRDSICFFDEIFFCDVLAQKSVILDLFVHDKDSLRPTFLCTNHQSLPFN